ncbi:chitin-binding domain protein cbd-1-like [Battus philenor]|uniref:chitin-binding domain protein cbd-1-like n=1 Tax=Battus philenor TaxID=42288 RepID=UPI0035CF4446
MDKLTLCLVLLGACACIAYDEHSVLSEYRQNIPQRCIEKTYTEVSCSDVSADALMVHPDDCQLFYQCVGDLPVCRQCPAALHFNPTKHVCDFPSRAGCRKRST